MKKFLIVCLLLANNAYGEYLYGITGNMAGTGHTWGMSAIGPSNNRGLRINGVYYQYTPVKHTDDDMRVHVRNKRIGGGYIFSVTDDWSGLPGGIPITKGFTVDNLPIELWGDGSIDVEGTGSVVDASVIYSYKYNNDCQTPLSDPSCPGYMDAVLAMADDYDATGYNPLDDKNITSTLDEQAEADKIEEEEEKEQEDSGELERALSGVDGSILASNIIAQDLLMTAMTRSIAIDSYYKKTLAGGEYKEKVVLIGGELLDNSKAARVTLAQQLLHTEMVSMQYNQR